ncbi:hypothetical protein F8M41_013409 [Gigaspora margarita]|uniref:C2H2-type domain-containing protein n=1 Tax=Gigaspora margarita TaxID=4874 RepID=A0A8H3WYR5_GIGMA|nr:hypothetical protein F8M41_013409 [Gigaspora margarita]
MYSCKIPGCNQKFLTTQGLGSHENWHKTIEIQNKVIHSEESFISQQCQLKTVDNKLELQTSILESQPSKINVRNLVITKESGKLQTKLIQANESSKVTQNELNNSSNNESIISESSDIFDFPIISNEQDYGFFDSLKTIVPEQSNKWQSYFPNESYADFIKLIINNNLSNSVGDDIIKFFNKHANRIDKPLPSSTQQGKSYIDKTE